MAGLQQPIEFGLYRLMPDAPFTCIRQVGSGLSILPSRDVDMSRQSTADTMRLRVRLAGTKAQTHLKSECTTVTFV